MRTVKGDLKLKIGVKDLLNLLLVVIMITVGQILAKKGISHLKTDPAAWFGLFLLACSYVLLFLRSLAWIDVLKRVDLSIAYSFLSVSFVTVLLASVFFFNEIIDLKKVIGSFLIICGIIITGLGGKK